MTDVLRTAYNEFAYYEDPLEWNDPRRVPLNERGVRGANVRSCVDFLRIPIEMSDRALCQLFTGFRGSGKSTELKCLARDLRGLDYDVVYIDSLAYLNLESRTSISQVLIALAGGFDAHLGELSPGTSSVRRFWDRLQAFLKTELTPQAIAVGVPGVGDLQVTLKQDATFRQQLDAAIAGRVPALARHCRSFIEEALAVMKQAAPQSRGAVVMFDSYEKLRGGEEVWQSVEDVFVRDYEFLRLPCHVIYTVPPWMAFLDFAPATGFGRVQTLPMCRILDPSTRQEHVAGMATMFELLGRRARLPELFQDPEQTLRPLVAASGGYPRDLLRLMCDLLVRIRGAGSPLPVSAPTLAPLVTQTIRDFASVFGLAICDEDLDLLVRTARDRSLGSFHRQDVHRLARLFDSHFILSYQNGDPWFDLHPLVRMTSKVTKALAADGNRPDPTPA